MSRGKLSKDRRELAGDSGNRNIIFILASFTALIVLAIGGFAVLVTVSNQNFAPNESGLLPVGSQAPGFTAETVNGGSVSLADTRGAEATMLVFFAGWCPHCNEEAPTIRELQGEYENLRVIMVGIDGRDGPTEVQEFVDEYGIEGPAVYDPSLGSTYQVSGYPTTYIVNADQEIVAAHSGEVPKEVLEGWIAEALSPDA